MQPQFFPTPADFRMWPSEHHHQHSELLVGIYKTNSGKPSMTWPESVDALFVWAGSMAFAAESTMSATASASRRAEFGAL
jgi:hypothetical protein